jgi:hypothetical protein
MDKHAISLMACKTLRGGDFSGCYMSVYDALNTVGCVSGGGAASASSVSGVGRSALALTGTRAPGSGTKWLMYAPYTDGTTTDATNYSYQFTTQYDPSGPYFNFYAPKEIWTPDTDTKLYDANSFMIFKRNQQSPYDFVQVGTLSFQWWKDDSAAYSGAQSSGNVYVSVQNDGYGDQYFTFTVREGYDSDASFVAADQTWSRSVGNSDRS